jgi:murein DD-endopeptidase MepM/ murein hydrolase activator NlpD
MRRSPFDGYEARVSVEELPAAAFGSLPSIASLRGLLASRLSKARLAGQLSKRAAVHASVFVLAAAVAAAGAFSGHQAASDSSAELSAAAGSINPAITAKTAIVARAIPLTNTGADAMYAVQPGDTLSSIAHAVNVNEEALLAFNGLVSSDALNVGMRLRIPDLAKVPPEQLRIQDTAPHEATPPIGDIGPQRPAPALTVREIQKGDNPYDLAVAAGVTESTVLLSNNLTESSLLSIGQTLVIPTMNGRLVATRPGDTVAALAARYSTTVEAIISANRLDPRTQTLLPDQLALIPTDVDVSRALVKDVPPQPQAEARAQPQPLPAPLPRAPAAPAPASAPGFSWPAPGVISTYFSSWHNGIDIANSSGTPVRAVQAGRVVYSGWDNSGFGYMVRIDHGNGLQTLYGHSSRLIAKAGDYVEKGQVIMLMGSTGRSTGPHLHFSVFQGSGYSALNPLRFLP